MANGKRGASSGGGAKGVTKLHLEGGGTVDLHQIIRQLGFNNIDQAKTALKIEEEIKKGGDTGKILKYLGEHGRRGLHIGSIMLRIGLPRNRLLDIAHALKPLRDHSIITAQFPIAFKHNERPFSFLGMRESDVSQISIAPMFSNIWLKRIGLLPDNLKRRLENS